MLVLHSTMITLTLACIFTVNGSLGFIANAIQIILTCRDKSQTKSVFGPVLLSLCIADLIISVVILLTGITCFLGIYMLIDAVTLNAIIGPLYLAAVFSIASSLTHIAFIAIQRLLAVVFPLKVKQIITKTRCFLVLILLWLISVASTIIMYINQFLGTLSIISIGGVASVVLLIAYPTICYKIMKGNVASNVSEEMQRRRRQSERGVMVYSVLITVICIVCSTPMALMSFLDYPLFLQEITYFLSSVNPFLDTMLYFMSSYCRRKRRKASVSVPTVNISMSHRNNNLQST